MNIQKMGVRCDLCEGVLIEAANKMGCVPLHDCTLYVSLEHRALARRLQAEHGFDLVMVPETLLKNRYGWALQHIGDLVYSEGCE